MKKEVSLLVKGIDAMRARYGAHSTIGRQCHVVTLQIKNLLHDRDNRNLLRITARSVDRLDMLVKNSRAEAGS